MAEPCMNVSNSSLFLLAQRAAVPNVSTISDIMRIFQLLCFGVICEAMALFGIGTNIANFICFFKQGFQESINISLLALAISDFGCLFTMIWSGLCFTPHFQETELPFDPLDFQYLLTGIPHIVFTRITSCITALITLERCLCVMMPLKVKSIFTPTKVAIMNICIFIILFVSFSPIYFSVRWGMVDIPERNRTILKLITLKHRMIIEQVSFAINSVLIPASALVIILVCMVIMVITLKRQSKWRQSHSGRVNVDASTIREERMVKMIVMISTLFVICFCPSVAILLMATIEPEFNVGGKYFDMAVFVYGFSAVAESTNSSMNIFIYYKMSTRYRSTFRQIFTRTTKSTSEKENNETRSRIRLNRRKASLKLRLTVTSDS